MKRFLRGKGLWLLLVAVLLWGLISWGGRLADSGVDILGSVVNTVVKPVRGGIGAVANWAESVYDYVFRYQQMNDELTTLRRRVAQIEGELRRGRQDSQENQRLRQLLQLREKRSDFVFESARISARGTRGWDDSLTLSKGSECGIAVDNCVITETGVLVGVVSQVGLNWATVDTVISPNIELGGQVVRADAAGILSGELALMQQGCLKLEYLPVDHGLMAGDEVLTSGRGGIYPEGLVVGTVTQAGVDESGLTGYALVEPTARLDKLAQVFIIKDFDIEE